MCREGGCGICIIQAKLYEKISDSKKSYPINSVSIIGVEDSLSIIGVENLLRIIDVENSSVPFVLYIHKEMFIPILVYSVIFHLVDTSFFFTISYVVFYQSLKF